MNALTQIDQSPAWIAEQLKRLNFGELTIKIIVHDGQVREVQRTVTEKIREPE